MSVPDSILPLDVFEVVIDLLSEDYHSGPYDKNRKADSRLTLRLYRDSLSSLRACSLVCHAFLPICRKHLFATVTISRRSPTMRAFNRVVLATPIIAGYIRHLHYGAMPDDYKESEALTKIARLRSLSICSDYGSEHGRFRWNEILHRPALLHLLRLPSLKQLTVLSIDNIIIADLALAVNLEHLTMGTVTTLPSLISISHPMMGLRDLTFTSSSAATITHMCTAQCIDGGPFIDFNKISVLTMETVSSDDAEALQKLLSRCTQLVKLVLNVSNPFGLGQLSKWVHTDTLKCLYISAMFEERTDDDPLCGIVHELEQMSSHNIIECISIEIYALDGLHRGREDDWVRLDRVLAQPGKWPMLRRVFLTLRVGCFQVADESTDEELASEVLADDFVYTEFPWLSTTSSVSFIFEATRG